MGNVLQVSQPVYAGRGGQANGQGACQLRALLVRLGRTVIAVPSGDALNLKSVATALPDGTFLLRPRLVRPDCSGRCVRSPKGRQPGRTVR